MPRLSRFGAVEVEGECGMIRDERMYVSGLFLEARAAAYTPCHWQCRWSAMLIVVDREEER